MEYLKKNLEELKRNRLSFYEKINDLIKNKVYNFEKFKIIDTRDGDQTIEIKDGDEIYRLNSLYSPQKEAKRWAGQYEFNNINASVVMFGIANGVFAKAILEKLKEDAIVFFIEPDISLFIYCLMNFDMCDIISDTRVYLFIDKINYESLYFAFLSKITEVMLPNQIVCTYPGMEKVYKEKAEKFMELIKRCYGIQLSLAIDSNQVYQKGIANTFKNLHFIKDSNYLTEFVGKIPEDVPVIIVSAGPSLDKNIAYLEKAEKKAFIIATDTAVKYLIAHDVHYDVIITKDIKKSDKHLRNEKCYNKPIISDIRSQNSILERNKGRKIWNNTSDFLYKLYGKYGLKYTSCMLGVSVATDAFLVAELVGAKRIVLIGQDLAFAGKYSHAGSVANHSYDEINGIFEVEGIYGDKVRARGDWVDMLQWFETEIAKIADKIDVIDATEGGAKIHGTRIMKLSEVIEQYCNTEFDFQKLLSEMPPTFSDDIYKKVREDIYHLKIELNDIYINAKEGIEAADNILSLIEEQDSNQYGKSISENTEIIKRNINAIEEQLVYSIINDYMETKISSALKINMLSEDENENIRVSCELSKEAFNAAIETVDYAMPILESALENI